MLGLIPSYSYYPFIILNPSLKHLSISKPSYLNGLRPNINWKNITPKDQISALSPYRCLRITSGAIVINDPKIVFFTVSFSLLISKTFENPKSAILHSPLWMRMFYSLRSLWIIFCLWKSATPLTTCLNKTTASSSGSLPLLYDNKSYNEPPLQYSIIMILRSLFSRTS